MRFFKNNISNSIIKIFPTPLIKYLNDSGKYEAIYANIEALQTARKDVSRGIRAVLVEIASNMNFFLLIFDHHSNRTWEEEIWDKKVEGIHMWG